MKKTRRYWTDVENSMFIGTTCTSAELATKFKISEKYADHRRYKLRRLEREKSKQVINGVNSTAKTVHNPGEDTIIKMPSGAVVRVSKYYTKVWVNSAGIELGF